MHTGTHAAVLNRLRNLVVPVVVISLMFETGQHHGITGAAPITQNPTWAGRLRGVRCFSPLCGVPPRVWVCRRHYQRTHANVRVLLPKGRYAACACWAVRYRVLGRSIAFVMRWAQHRACIAISCRMHTAFSTHASFACSHCTWRGIFILIALGVEISCHA